MLLYVTYDYIYLGYRDFDLKKLNNFIKEKWIIGLDEVHSKR